MNTVIFKNTFTEYNWHTRNFEPYFGMELQCFFLNFLRLSGIFFKIDILVYFTHFCLQLLCIIFYY